MILAAQDADGSLVIISPQKVVSPGVKVS
jgi:hypothetical protein